MYSFTEENYLKAILFLSRQNERGASTSAIAERLETKAASVSDMLKKLGEKELVVYEKYKGAELTESGKAIAVRTLRKHRLWEVFLVKKMNFGWEEVHEVAEQLEHIQSTKLTDELDAFLGFPKYDPHGDPIPDREGAFPKRPELTLAECAPGEDLIVTGVKDSSVSFLKYLEKSKIGLGSMLHIVEKESFDGSIQARLNDAVEISLSAKASSNLYVKHT